MWRVTKTDPVLSGSRILSHGDMTPPDSSEDDILDVT